MRLLVTRPQPQADEWVARLRERGVDAHALPLLSIEDSGDATARAEVAEAWARLGDHALVMFVSPNAVIRFFGARPAGAGWPAGTLAGSTGPGSTDALRQVGVPPQSIVEPDRAAQRFDAEALWARLRDRRAWGGASVLIVRGENGRDWLAETLRGQGAMVAFVQAYRRAAPVLDAAQRQLLDAARARPESHGWLFSSSQAVAQLPGLAPGADWSAAPAIATHARIADAARAIGFQRVATVPPALDAIVGEWGRSLQSRAP
jgi:uroporphyrinogen-III synthase